MINFIEQLPQSDSFVDILVIMDRLTKQTVFVLTHRSINAIELTNLFIQYIFSKYKVPLHVTLDRGLKFISRFYLSITMHS